MSSSPLPHLLPRLLAVSFGLCTVFGATAVHGQAVGPDLRQGSVIRVTAPDQLPRPLEATFLGVDEATLRVRPSSGEAAVELLRSEIEALEWSSGERRRWKIGAALGALALGVPAALYCRRECEGDPTAPELVGFAIGAVPGALLGAAIGSLVHTRSWHPLPLEWLDRPRR